MALPQDTTTIEEFIESGKSVTIDYMTLSFLDQMQNGTWVSVLNVVNDYMEEIRSACLNVKLSKEQQQAYFYKPKLLCYDVYGSPELYFLILLINDMADVKEFTKEVVKMPRRDHMNTLISLIYNAEKAAINAYNDKDNQGFPQLSFISSNSEYT